MVFPFALACGFGSLLLFIVQPLVAKLMLPFFGGTPEVWLTSILFFQLVLVAGYSYVFVLQFVQRKWSAKKAIITHLVLVALLVFMLPLAETPPFFTLGKVSSSASVLLTLLRWVGVPVFILSTSAPLLQHLFTHGAHTRAKDPYFLYAASNLGSLAGLLAFPLAAEPFLGGKTMLTLWSWGMVGYTAVLGVCLFSTLKETIASEAAPQKGLKPTWLLRILWVLLAFVPSSLLLGVTSYITMDVASFPLLWVVPLALYLLTYMIAFSKMGPAWLHFWVRAQLIVVAATVLFFSYRNPSIILLHFLSLFASAMVFHGLLAEKRPATAYLPEYYIWLAVGGALGGIFNLFVAPEMFTDYLEYPLMLLAAIALRHVLMPVEERWDEDLGQDLKKGGMVLLMMGIYFFSAPYILGPAEAFIFRVPVPGHDTPFEVELWPRLLAETAVLIGICLYACISWRRPVLAALVLMAALTSTLLPEPNDVTVVTERNFFGVLRVVDRGEEVRYLLHGTTMHGSQFLAEDKRRIVTSYYAIELPEILSLKPAKKPLEVALVGLGTGSSTCLFKGQDFVDIYEINPAVIEIAKNPDYFTYLQDCPPQMRIIHGDGRLSMAAAPDGSYDVIILDAFSSDSIPLHLLTREALALYLKKLKPDGLIALHLSNRHLELFHVAKALAADAHLAYRAKFTLHGTEVMPKEWQDKMLTYSKWVAIARKEKTLKPLDAKGWDTSKDMEPVLWTDDHASILKVMALE